MNRSEELIENMCNHSSSLLVKAGQCAYGLHTPSEAGPSVMAPALKPMPCASAMVGGRCKDAAMYPAPLVQAILRGIALQSKEGKMMDHDRIYAMPMSYSSSPPRKWEFGPATYSSIPAGNGGTVPIMFDPQKLKISVL